MKKELSKKNPYYISKHKYYELKHFCLQYSEWSEEYYRLMGKATDISATNDYKTIKHVLSEAKYENYVIKADNLKRKMDLVKDCCEKADLELADYIFKAVTKEYSYEYLSTVLEIPASRDTYYDRYRRFFYILSNYR